MAVRNTREHLVHKELDGFKGECLDGAVTSSAAVGPDFPTVAPHKFFQIELVVFKTELRQFILDFGVGYS